MAPQKGKQGTKGQKQILDENLRTQEFYTAMCLSALIIYNSVMVVLYWESYTAFYMCLSFSAAMTYIGCLQSLKSMAKPTYSETGQLVDGGIDLNMEAGFAENIKDLIILTATVHVTSLLSSYMWFFWLLAPARAFYILWVNVLSPWFFSPAPEMDEKKQKKLERKAKRH